MALIDIKWNPTARELRLFAVLWLVFFGLLAVWMFSRGSSSALIASIAALALIGGVFGMLWPKLIRPVYLLWMTLVFPIGWLVSHLILALVYFCILTPIGLVMRATGHDPLGLKPDPRRTSYWSEKPADSDESRYFRQF